MLPIRIAGIGTAVAEHGVEQAEVRRVIEALFSSKVRDLQRLMGVFEHIHIGRRHLMQTPEWYAEERSFAELNEAYAQAAIGLALESSTRALADAGLDATELAGLVVVSTTGIMTPSLDAVVLQQLGMDPHATRLPVFGLGCAGGVSGLARAAELSQVRGGRPVLMIAVEICSATFQRNDVSKSNLVGASLFADGAAAVIVSSAGRGPHVLSSFSTLFSNTYDIMGWDVVDEGLRVRFSRDIPTFVRENIPSVLADACQAWGVTASEITGFITHPGGAKVLDAYAEAVLADPSCFDAARKVLYEYGNMSSASVLFVLEHMMKHRELVSGHYVMSALGPGFSAENLLLRCE